MRQLRQMLRLAGEGTSGREIALTLGSARRLVYNAYRIELTGDCMRKQRAITMPEMAKA